MEVIAALFSLIMLALAGLALVGMWWVAGFWAVLGLAAFFWLLFRQGRDDAIPPKPGSSRDGGNAFQRSASRDEDG